MGLFSPKHTDALEITISNKTVIRVLILVFGSLIALAALGRVTHALGLIFIAFFLSLSLNAPVHWVSLRLPGRKRGSRTLATGVSFLVVVALLGAFIVSVVPPLVRQTGSFINAAPDLITDLRSEDSSVGEFIRRYGLESQTDNLSNQVSNWASSLTGEAFSTAGRVTTSIVSLLTVLVLTYMMLIEGPRWLRVFKRLVPIEKQAHTEKLVKDMYKVIKGYVNGQVLLAAIAALLIAPPLFILGISYPVALVVVVFICGLIPMVGHTIGAVIVGAVALFTSPFAALIMVAYYFAYQQIENYAVQPRIQANTTDMSPLLVFASVVIGVNFNGIIGGLVAIPIAGCLRILILDYMFRKNYLVPEKKQELKK